MRETFLVNRKKEEWRINIVIIKYDSVIELNYKVFIYI